MRRRASRRLITRLAWRQLRRTTGSSLLVASLIAVPVAGAVGAVTFVESRVLTPEQATRLELGATQSWIQIAGGADPSRTQAYDAPWATQVETAEDGTPRNPEQPPPIDLGAAAIPSGAESIRLDLHGAARMKTPTGVASFSVVAGESWDQRLTGRYEMLSGRPPSDATEALASPALLERLQQEVGGEAVLTESGQRMRITGTLRALDGHSDPATLFIPLSATQPPEQSTWFFPTWQPDAAELRGLNQAGYVAYARDLVLRPPADAPLLSRTMDSQGRFGILATASVAATFIALLVGLLSGAALAVTTRRQQRSLALLATVGARRTDAFRLVLEQGALLGLGGGLIGAAVGIAATAAGFALFDPGVAGTFWSSPGLRVPWTAPVIILFAVLVGALAAVVPARSATRGDPLAALRGARRPVTMSARQPVWGVVILLVGAVTVTGSGVALSAVGDAAVADPIWTLVLWSFIIGVLLLLFGVLISGRGILVLMARALPALGPAARLASRDTVANASRTVPAFAAIAASVTVAAFVLCAIAISGANNDRSYIWAAPKGSVIVQAWGAAYDRPPVFLADARPERIISVSSTVEPNTDAEGTPIDPPSTVASLATSLPALAPTDAAHDWREDYGTQLTVVDPADLEALTGASLTTEQLRAYRDGGAVATDPAYVGPNGEARVLLWGARDPGDPAPEPESRVDVPVELLNGPRSWPVILSPAAAAAHGITVVKSHWVGLYADEPPLTVQDRLNADAETASIGDAAYHVRVERGPDPALPWLLLVLAAASLIVIAAAAISLGLARIERREDDATLAAVGGTGRLRRAVSAWQSLIIVGVGCLVGTALGVVGAWGLTQLTSLSLADLPVLWLLAIAVGLPLVISLVSLLIRPPRADLTRRTAIA